MKSIAGAIVVFAGSLVCAVTALAGRNTQAELMSFVGIATIIAGVAIVIRADR